MSEQILQKLAGGDRRSTGQADEVAEQILGDAELIEVVFNAMLSGEPVLRMRAADAIEKASRQRPELLAPYKMLLLEAVAAIDQHEVRWHAAQMLPRLELDPAERAQAVAILESFLQDESKIVQVNALQALADLARADEQLRRRLIPVLKDSAVLAHAIRKLIPEEERDGGVASETHLRRALEDKACYFIVCLIDSTPAGYLSAFRFPTVYADCYQIYLFEIEVEERHRRRGIASGMIAELKRQCAGDRIDYIWVGTDLGNLAAQKTFEKAGAQNISETYLEYIFSLNECA